MNKINITYDFCNQRENVDYGIFLQYQKSLTILAVTDKIGCLPELETAMECHLRLKKQKRK